MCKVSNVSNKKGMTRVAAILGIFVFFIMLYSALAGIKSPTGMAVEEPVSFSEPTQRPSVSAKMMSLLLSVLGVLVMMGVIIIVAFHYVRKYAPGWAMTRGIKEGIAEKDLLRIAMERGLPEKSARQLMREKEVKRLREIIVKNIMIGHDTLDIKSHLISKGWKRSLIDEAMGVKKGK